MKRFTETDKWKDKWFCGLPSKHKLLYLYMVDNCDSSGVIELFEPILQVFIGPDIEIESFLESADGRIITLPDGKLWIERFIEFQYGCLSEKSKIHQSVIRNLKKHNLLELAARFIVDQSPTKAAERSRITEKYRLEIFQRDEFKCQYCGDELVLSDCIVDHVEPLSLGGSNQLDNLVTACDKCNSKKSDKNVFKYLLEENLKPLQSLSKILKRIKEKDKVQDKDKGTDTNKDKVQDIDLNSETPAQLIEKKVRGLQPDWQGPLSYNEQSAIVRERALFEGYDWELVKSWFDSRPEKLPSNRMKFIESGGVSEQTRAREWRNGSSKQKEPWQIEKEIQRLETEIEKIRVNEKSLNRSRGHLMSRDQFQSSKQDEYETWLEDQLENHSTAEWREAFWSYRASARRDIETGDALSERLREMALEAHDSKSAMLAEFAEKLGFDFWQWTELIENPWIDPNGLTPEAKQEIEKLKKQIEAHRADLRSVAA